MKFSVYMMDLMIITNFMDETNHFFLDRFILPLFSLVSFHLHCKMSKKKQQNSVYHIFPKPLFCLTVKNLDHHHRRKTKDSYGLKLEPTIFFGIFH